MECVRSLTGSTDKRANAARQTSSAYGGDMKIVVVGGSGRIGARLVTLVTRGDHDVVAASRRSGIDVVTGEGLAEALRGASVVRPQRAICSPARPPRVSAIT